jgi:hypothetical protein
VRRELRGVLWAVALFGAAWGVFRLYAADPFEDGYLLSLLSVTGVVVATSSFASLRAAPLNKQRFSFLLTTPWRPGDRIPFHSWSPCSVDLALLVLVSAFAWVEGWREGVILLGPLSLLHIMGTGIQLLYLARWQSLAAFVTGISLLPFACSTTLHLFLGFLLIFPLCWWIDHALLRQLWNTQVQGWSMPEEPPIQDLGMNALAPREYAQRISRLDIAVCGVAISFSLLGFMSFFARFCDNSRVVESDELFAFGSVLTAGIGLLRIALYLGFIGMRTSLSTRLRRGRLIDPVYDKVFLPLIAGGLILLVGGLINQSYQSLTLAMVTTTLAIVTTATLGPSFEQWRLTAPGVVRLQPLNPPRQRPAR